MEFEIKNVNKGVAITKKYFKNCANVNRSKMYVLKYCAF